MLGVLSSFTRPHKCMIAFFSVFLFFSHSRFSKQKAIHYPNDKLMHPGVGGSTETIFGTKGLLQTIQFKSLPFSTTRTPKSDALILHDLCANFLSGGSSGLRCKTLQKINHSFIVQRVLTHTHTRKTPARRGFPHKE